MQGGIFFRFSVSCNCKFIPSWDHELLMLCVYRMCVVGMHFGSAAFSPPSPMHNAAMMGSHSLPDASPVFSHMQHAVSLFVLFSFWSSFKCISQLWVLCHFYSKTWALSLSVSYASPMVNDFQITQFMQFISFIILIFFFFFVVIHIVWYMSLKGTSFAYLWHFSMIRHHLVLHLGTYLGM